MIIEDDDSKSQLINFTRIAELFSLYKFPLILAGIGLFFLLVGIIYTLNSRYTSGEVVFSSESSSSGILEKTKIYVDVEGAVMSPGVYQVEEGSRITTVLTSAGGLSPDADREWISKNMNLAMKVTDGGKIYIPATGENLAGKITNDRLPVSTTGRQITNVSGNSGQLLGVTTGKVNINTASQAELEGLPGIGPVTAGKIISSRPYQTIEELKSKKAVGNAVFEKIKDLIVTF